MSVPSASRMRAILLLRCPRCLEGRVFVGTFTMQEQCEHCEHRFEREPGYFLGAMYVSYFMSIPILGLIAWILHRFVFPTWTLDWIVVLSIVPYLLFVPLVFRYSRVIWMHFDTPID